MIMMQVTSEVNQMNGNNQSNDLFLWLKKPGTIFTSFQTSSVSITSLTFEYNYIRKRYSISLHIYIKQ